MHANLVTECTHTHHLFICRYVLQSTDVVFQARTSSNCPCLKHKCNFSMDEKECQSLAKEDPRVTGEPRLWFLSHCQRVYPGGTPFSLIRTSLKSQQHKCFANMAWKNQEYLMGLWVRQYTATVVTTALCRPLENYVLLQWEFAYYSTFFAVNNW